MPFDYSATAPSAPERASGDSKAIPALPATYTPGVDPTKDALVYERLMQRELEQDHMLWQTPSIALAAQAFLMTIALSPETLQWPRAGAAFLGILVAFLSLQLMAKHRFLCKQDRAQLEELEAAMNLPPISMRRRYFDGKGNYFIPAELEQYSPPSRQRWLTRMSSYTLWFYGMWVFVALNAAILCVTFVMHGVLHASG